MQTKEIEMFEFLAGFIVGGSAVLLFIKGRAYLDKRAAGPAAKRK
jgi:hypothetical protein